MARFTSSLITLAAITILLLSYSGPVNAQVASDGAPASKIDGTQSKQSVSDRAGQFHSRLDKNGDGKVSQAEAPTRFWQTFRQFDADGDGAINKEEFINGTQELRSRRGAGAPPGTPRRFSQYDKDSDGKVTKDEVDENVWASIVAHDTNKDGAIDREEYQQGARKQSLKLWLERFARLDKNGDGKLSKLEATTSRMFSRLVDRYDTDGDGSLDKEEFARPIMAGQLHIGGGGPGNGGPGGPDLLQFANRLFTQNDADGDGKITASEVVTPIITRNFEKLDTDGSKSIEKTELTRELPKLVPFGPPGGFGRPRNLAGAVVRVLESKNFLQLRTDDQISERMHENLLRRLDPMKLYFLQADIDEFSADVKLHDDHLKENDMSFAEKVFARYLERLKERTQWAEAFAYEEFDFDEPEDRVILRAGAEYAKSVEEAKHRWRDEVKFRLLQLMMSGESENDARRRVKDDYQRLRKLKATDDPDTATAAYLDALARAFDPHSSFLSPAQAEQARIRNGKSLEGIGAQLAQRDGEMVVISIIPGGPVDEDGRLAPDDKILGVGQGAEGTPVSVAGYLLRDVVELIRGEADTTVKLDVQKPDGQREVYEIVRRKFNLPGLKSQVISADSNVGSNQLKIGVARIPNFYQQPGNDGRSVATDMEKALKEFSEESVDAVLIDLRSNSGGSLEAMVAMTGLFIDQGPVTQIRRPGSDLQVRSDDVARRVYEGPLAVLVNRYSGSASELFAMAVQDYQRGIIIGDSQTFGKGTAAVRIDIARTLRRRGEALGMLQYTHAKTYGPSGRSVQLDGVKADIVLPSLTDHAMVGESTLDFTFPNDTIEPTDFTPSKDITKAMVRDLRERSEKRQHESAGLVRIKEERQHWIEHRKKALTTFSKSILEDSEIDELTKLRNELTGRSTETFGENAYEAEVLQILVDLVELRERRDEN